MVPDEGVRSAFLACFADLWIMREPIAGGYIGCVPGTEVYRATNSAEGAILAIALDQAGFHEDAARGLQVNIDMQGSDGDWSDPMMVTPSGHRLRPTPWRSTSPSRGT